MHPDGNEPNVTSAIDEYLAGPEKLRRAIGDMTNGQLDATPIAGRWSTRQVVCHLADFEVIYADRIKRVIAEDGPTLFGGDPVVFADRLAYDRRDVQEELQLIEAVRLQVTRILRTLPAEEFQRMGSHTEAGPMTLAVLLRNITDHIPHHLRFIEQKRKALGL